MKRLFFLLLICLFSLESFSQARPFSHGGERRRFTVYLPSEYAKQPGKQFPLVFNFHGGGMTMTEMMFYSRMNEAAEKHQFIVVYPQGIRQDWNVGFDMPYQMGTDDVGFTKALLEHISKEYRVNEARVYATGLSRGGFFCQRLAAELPGKFAAIASVGGPLPDSVAFFHKQKTPMPFLMIHGDEDGVVNYSGKTGAYQSAAATYAYWKKLNGLEGLDENRKTVNKSRKDSTSVEVLETKGNGLAVSLVTVRGGGHTWPGSDPFNIGFPLGRTTRDIDANELIWKFFSAHAKEKKED